MYLVERMRKLKGICATSPGWTTRLFLRSATVESQIIP